MGFNRLTRGKILIGDGSIVARMIDALAVTTAKLAANAVTSAKLDVSTIQYAEVALTNAQVLALRATPIALVAAPGAGKVIEFVSAEFIFDYTAAYTEDADNLAVKYTDGSGAKASADLETTGFLDATSDQLRNLIAIGGVVQVANAALVLHNLGGEEFGGGNAANALRVKVAYRVHTTGL